MFTKIHVRFGSLVALSLCLTSAHGAKQVQGLDTLAFLLSKGGTEIQRKIEAGEGVGKNPQLKMIFQETETFSNGNQSEDTLFDLTYQASDDDELSECRISATVEATKDSSGRTVFHEPSVGDFKGCETDAPDAFASSEQSKSKPKPVEAATEDKVPSQMAALLYGASTGQEAILKTLNDGTKEASVLKLRLTNVHRVPTIISSNGVSTQKNIFYLSFRFVSEKDGSSVTCPIDVKVDWIKAAEGKKANFGNLRVSEFTGCYADGQPAHGLPNPQDVPNLSSEKLNDKPETLPQGRATTVVTEVLPTPGASSGPRAESSLRADAAAPQARAAGAAQGQSLAASDRAGFYTYSEFLGFGNSPQQCARVVMQYGPRYQAYAFGSKHFVNSCFGINYRPTPYEYRSELVSIENFETGCKATAKQLGYTYYKFGGVIVANACFGQEKVGGSNPPPSQANLEVSLYKASSASAQLKTVLADYAQYAALAPKADRINTGVGQFKGCLLEDKLSMNTCRPLYDATMKTWSETVPEFYSLHQTHQIEKVGNAFRELARSIEQLQGVVEKKQH